MNDNLDYYQYFHIDGDKVTCMSPTPERETFTQTSYNARTLREEGRIDSFIESLKVMVGQKIIRPDFGEIIIQSARATEYASN
jgi:hypothetical protein